MAYVDIDTPEGADMAEGRRIRRQELARGWRFACECSRCVEESAIVAAAAATATLEEKEKVEDLSGDVPPPLEDVPAEEVEVAVPENAEVDQEAIEEKTLGEASEEKSGGGLAGADTPMTWSVISENQPHDDEPAAAVVEQPVVSDEKLAEEWPVVGHEPEHPKEEEEYDGPIIAE